LTYGTVTNFDDNATVRFDRVIGETRESIWRALTDGNVLGRWLASATLEPRVGGRVAIDFGEGQRVDGTVIALEAPRLLEYSWMLPDQEDSVLRFELAADGQNTHVLLEHRLLPPDQAAGYGAGWHAYLDSLQALAEGTDPIEWEQRFSEVLGHYAGA
jgi:uncharacterized protein YndB with AHSA1/START domain